MNLLTILEVAEKLKDWADNLSYNPRSTTKVQLSPNWRYKKVILLLLEKTNVGAKVQSDFAELDRLHQEYESWRGRAITQDNEEQFEILVDSFKGTLYDLADTLQQIAQNATDELSAEKPTATAQNAGRYIPGRIRILLKKVIEKGWHILTKSLSEALLDKLLRN